MHHERNYLGCYYLLDGNELICCTRYCHEARTIMEESHCLSTLACLDKSFHGDRNFQLLLENKSDLPTNLGRTCRKQFTESFCLLHVHELSMHRSPCSQLDSLFKTLCLFWQVTHFHSLIISEILLLHIYKGS